MATISKTSTFEVPKFSQSFSPVPLGSACGRPQLPRLHTTASRSCERPRRGRPAASRGKCSRGCEGERQWPFPQTTILGGKPPGAWDSYEDEMLNHLF